VPTGEWGIEHIFVFVGSLVLSRRLCSLVESDEQAGSYRFVCRIRTENALVLIEKFSNSGDVKGTIPDSVRHHFVPNDVRRHRVISTSYISLLPCHGTA
jgi:hypothetical protein